MTESHNRGWSAASDGSRPTPVVLDGWRQGFVLPAGTAGSRRARLRTAGAVPVGARRWTRPGGAPAPAGGPAPRRRAGAPPLPATGRRRPSGTASHRSADRPGWVAVVVLALVSLPLAAGALVGWATRAPVRPRRRAAPLHWSSPGSRPSASAVVVPPVVPTSSWPSSWASCPRSGRSSRAVSFGARCRARTSPVIPCPHAWSSPCCGGVPSACPLPSRSRAPTRGWPRIPPGRGRSSAADGWTVAGTLGDASAQGLRELPAGASSCG